MKQFQPLIYAEAQTKTGNYAKEDSVLFRWTGTHWSALSDHEADQIAFAWLKKRDRRHASAEHARRCARALLLDAPTLAEPPADVCIPCMNGYVILRDNAPTLIAPDKSLGVRHVLGCHYDPIASRAPRFDAFLEQVIPDLAVRGRVQEYAGYSLTGDARYQRVMMFYGPGANGKGALSNIIQALHGDGVGAAWLDSMDGARLSGVVGKSLIVVDEIPQGRLDERPLKSAFAGERIPIDIKYRTPITARLLGKWLILGNHLPLVMDDTDGFWRRWDIVNFNVTIPDSERDPMLASRIIEHELPAVLNWAMAGLVRLQTRGNFDPVRPAAIESMTLEAKLQTSSVHAWVEDNGISVDPDVVTLKDDIFAHFCRWCERNRRRHVDSAQFWKKLGTLLKYEDRRVRIPGGQKRCVTVALPDTRTGFH